MRATYGFLGSRWRAAVVLLCALLPGPVVAADAALENFFAGAVQPAIEARQLAGAAVAVVADGQLQLARGYGYADLALAQPLTAETSLLRVGSISKVLVWIAVLQLVEQGKVDLDADVNGYLDEPLIPETMPGPVTLRHLMTHTPGFEDRLWRLMSRGRPDQGGLAEILAERLPERLWLPGSVVAYSNYGAGLAALVVEQVSGVPFETYAREFILVPLGMRQSTLEQPVPESLRGDLSRGYISRPAGLVPSVFEFLTPAPAGSLSTSAADMARLMAELLNPGGSVVLSAASKKLLFTRAISLDDQLNGMTLGLYEMRLGDGVRAVGHNGDTLLFHARMVLWPERQLGLFLGANTDRSALLLDSLVEAFAARRGLTRRNQPLATSIEAARYQGYYFPMRRPESSALKLLGLLQSVRVKASAEQQSLEIRALDGRWRTYTAVSDTLFEVPDGYERAAFRLGDRGASELALSRFPMLGYERAQWYQRPDVNAAGLAVLVLLAALALVLWPLTSLTRRQTRPPAGQGRASFVGWIAALAVLVFVFEVAREASDPVAFMLDGPAGFSRSLWLPVLLVPLGLVLVVFTVRAWFDGYWWLLRRLHFTLLTLAVAAFLAWCGYWNLHPGGVPY